MKNSLRAPLCWSAALSLALAFGIFSANASGGTTKNHQQSQDPAAQTQSQTVSGKITAVEKSSFSIAVATARKSSAGHQFVEQGASPQTMSFTVDKNTTIDGKLAVGASADVTYRQENGNNIAISVHVVQ